MARLGIIGGSAFLEGPAPRGTEPRRMDTDLGTVQLHVDDVSVFLRRHGDAEYRPPHRIPHHAHALALETLGVRHVVGLCSVGGLRPEMRPGTVIVPDDYLSYHPPPTFARNERLHVVPTLDDSLRRLLLDVAGDAGGTVRDGGVYAETRGPRFETRAEVRLLAEHADVVGMTAASEATLLQERGLSYALLGVVDNFAHGVGDESLTLEAFDRAVDENRERARWILRALRERAPELAPADEPPEAAGAPE